MPLPRWMLSPVDTALNRSKAYVRVLDIIDDYHGLTGGRDILFSQRQIANFLDLHLFNNGHTCWAYFTFLTPLNARAWLWAHLDLLIDALHVRRAELEMWFREEADPHWVYHLNLAALMVQEEVPTLRGATIDTAHTRLGFLIGLRRVPTRMQGRFSMWEIFQNPGHAPQATTPQTSTAPGSRGTSATPPRHPSTGGVPRNGTQEWGEVPFGNIMDILECRETLEDLISD